MVRKYREKKVAISVRLPEDLLERVRERLHDPLRNQVKHGSLTDVITNLLYEWLQSPENTLDKL
jgi:hypothetical protein